MRRSGSLDAAGEKFGMKFDYTDVLAGGCAIDAEGVPLPQKTVDICKDSDAVLLGAMGGPKWDNLPGDQRPEAGLLGIRKALGLWHANLRPAMLFDELRDASRSERNYRRRSRRSRCPEN